jgi:YgiT-type zinc finger domain-containing protein
MSLTKKNGLIVKLGGNKMNCSFCGGKVVNKNITFIYEDPDNYILVENVPAEVCEHCGEKTYSPKVTDDLLRIAKKELKPRRTINIPVYDFSEQLAVN